MNKVLVLGILAMVGIGMAAGYVVMASPASMSMNMRSGVQMLWIPEISGDDNDTNDTTGAGAITISRDGEFETMHLNPEDVKPLTDEEREEAKQIALADPEVQKLIDGKEYEIGHIGEGYGVRVEGDGVRSEMRFASLELLVEGMIYHVHIDLEKGEVTRISPPFSAGGVMIRNGTATTYGEMENGKYGIVEYGKIEIGE
ncbi:hypothetical protein FHEFKHOI_01745 [Candidatus Methanoperedenaceae archaeon GB50]|nr:MAG: hypothetical protein KBONHNOK_00206 [Candidatus Methanoperedenaceae archaeon GB50]CAD7775294.1 hypothetical protein FHEFKHOI_01745 [Candidatus Methanoperedenaceae archaeon GB50]